MESQNTIIIADCLRQKRPAIMGELLEAYGDTLYGIIIRIVHSRELADEVLQETLLKVWKNGENYDSTKGQLFTWLFNLARNTAIDATRTAHFQRRKNMEPFDEATCPSESRYDSLDYLDLSFHLARLEEKYRILIELTYFKGYTQEEISKEMQIPVGTVKTRLRSGIERLQKIFPKELVFN